MLYKAIVKSGNAPERKITMSSDRYSSFEEFKREVKEVHRNAEIIFLKADTETIQTEPNQL